VVANAREAMKTAKFVDPHADQRRSEAEKTAKLRALRMAKEAADRETAEREAAEQALRSPAPRRRAKQTSTPASGE